MLMKYLRNVEQPTLDKLRENYTEYLLEASFTLRQRSFVTRAPREDRKNF